VLWNTEPPTQMGMPWKGARALNGYNTFMHVLPPRARSATDPTIPYAYPNPYAYLHAASIRRDCVPCIGRVPSLRGHDGGPAPTPGGRWGSRTRSQAGCARPRQRRGRRGSPPSSKGGTCIKGTIKGTLKDTIKGTVKQSMRRALPPGWRALPALTRDLGAWAGWGRGVSW